MTKTTVFVERVFDDGTVTTFPLADASDRIVKEVAATLSAGRDEWLMKARTTTDPDLAAAYLMLAEGAS